jgi:uncharacterized repeat protein (TIGR01451 family)
MQARDSVGSGTRGRWRRAVLATALATAALLGASGRAEAAAGPAADLDQCRNGTLAAPEACSGASWQNGNLGSENAHYREGDSVPFRAVVTDLSTTGSHTLTIEYDTLAGGKHAYDYLTSYNRTETSAAPCSGVSPCIPGAGAAIPGDALSFANPASSQASGSISIWNGAISSIAYGGSDAAGKRSVTITFTATASTVVLAWGGHVASQLDWGAGNAAGAISGSPYHMRVLSLDGKAGNQDRSMKSGAILPVPATFTTTASASTVDVGQPVTDTATLSGPNGPASGSVTFSVCGPDLVANPDCSTGGLQLGGPVAVAGGSATSSAFTPTMAGNYCFRAQYAPDAFAGYSPGSHTNKTTECFKAVIATGKLEVRKELLPSGDAGRFDLLVDGGAKASGVGDGGTTGEQVVTVGAHTVGETASAGSLSDYVSSIVCRDGDGAGATVAQGTGTSIPVSVTKNADVVCTITNVRKPPPPPAKATLTVVKHVVNDNGGTASAGDFAITVTGNGPSPSSFSGSEAGTQVKLDAGGYSVAETVAAGYTASYSSECEGTIAPGESKTCTITNDDNAPPPPAKAMLTVVKHVVNDDGGAKAAGDFSLAVSGTNASPSGFAGSEAGTAVELDAGSYSVSESSVDGYTASYSADCSGTIAAGESKTCTVVNDDAPAPKATLTVIKHVVNDDGGTKAAGDFSLSVTGGNANPSGFSGSETGTQVQLEAGAYSVTEAAVAGYAATYSEGCSGTIAAGGTATCTVTNDDIASTPPPPAKAALTVIKHVVNDDGGTKTAGDFSLSVSGTNASPSSFAGSESGTNVSLDAGSYSVTESAASGYTVSYSVGCSGSVAAGGTATCTVTNDDVESTPPPPAKATLTVVKHVVNDNGGAKTAGDFSLSVSGANASPSSFAGSENGTSVSLDAGSYSVTEGAVTGYTASYSTGCSGTIAAGGSATCTVTNDDVAAPPPAKATLKVIKHVVNDNGGTRTAGDFSLSVSGANASPSGFAGSENGTSVSLDAGTYNVTEGAVSGYAVSYSAGCSGTIAAGGSATCTVTNDDVAAPTPPTPTPPTPTPPTPTPPTPAPPSVDLAITKTDTPDPAFVGGRLQYTLRVTNNGSARATGVTVADPIPDDLQFVSVTTTQGTCTGGPVVTCALGALEVGATATVRIVIRPLAAGLVLNTATVKGAEADPIPGNNTASAPTLIEGPFAPPRPRCAQLVVAKRTLTAGTRTVVVARVRLDRLGIRGMRITIRGAGITASGRTNTVGIARIAVRPTRQGIAVVRMVGQPARCGVRRIGVVGTFRPPSLTG